MIRIRISEEALDDLDDGYWFYEIQESGLGDYFASTLKAEIEGLRITQEPTGGITWTITARSAGCSHMPSTTPSRRTKWWYGRWSTADTTRIGFDITWMVETKRRHLD